MVFPERLTVDTAPAPAWEPVAWERLLGAYARSDDAWVRRTAEAWLAHLDRSLPRVGPDTRWGVLDPDEEYAVALQARASWLFSCVSSRVGIHCDLVTSAAGNSSVVRVMHPASVDGYVVMAEVEERRSVRSPRTHADARPTPLGPAIKVALRQDDVDTSAGFDWHHLAAMAPLMEAARSDWHRRAARPRHAHDRANHEAMVAAGGPAWLGYGFGEAQTKINRQCMFGAKIHLDPEMTLGDLCEQMCAIAGLVEDLAQLPPPAR